jgi:hypothetical protein
LPPEREDNDESAGRYMVDQKQEIYCSNQAQRNQIIALQRLIARTSGSTVDGQIRIDEPLEHNLPKGCTIDVD